MLDSKFRRFPDFACVFSVSLCCSVCFLDSYFLTPAMPIDSEDLALLYDPCALIWTLEFLVTWISLNSVFFFSSVCLKTMAVCMNCHIVLQPRIELHEYLAVNLNPDLVMIVEEWCGREVTEEDILCQRCVNLIVREAANRIEIPDHRSDRQYGHDCVCISCGISLIRRSGRRRHRILAASMERNFIENQIFPRQVPEDAWSCHNCWMRVYSNMRQNQAEPPLEIPVQGPGLPVEVENLSAPSSRSATVPSSESDPWSGTHPVSIDVPSQDINLQSYTRTPDTTNHCFVPDCGNQERLRVPRYLRKAILSQYKLYVTQNARVCRDHITVFNWEFLNEYEFTSSFNASQIEEMLNLLSDMRSSCVLNFENVQGIHENLCRYWTGLSVVNFMALFNSVPQLEEITTKAKTALGLYLVKLRTGESIRRIASLFLLSTGTVTKYLKKVRICLIENYVPLHLGVGHITRDEHSARNLLIHQGLFGTDDNNPIVICDGTYIYLQKSSNYLFQKMTYSLHKYRNLVKPFLLVTCDGRILHVSGPHAATESDAEIISKLFQNSDSPMRSYFRENDIFILDRGFRDAIGLLESLGYSVYKPESLSQNETQLSTIKANKSRLVTLCRWVVEVVNGRFKRDFKIFRGEYFNIASRNLMTDFKVAAALINNFHPVLTDRPDAQAILDRAQARLEMPNNLSNYVIGHRLNRRTANFVNIDAQLPQLNVFPIMEMSDLILFALGTYQIKQAKSYYGEHIRQNGTFVVEVDTELHQHFNNSVLLRARIRSRHISRKKYYTYILLDMNSDVWSERIKEYYCSCLIGKRTVGSCAHIMTIVWYLGWARHQETPILPPAQFLDYVIIREDLENEEY